MFVSSVAMFRADLKFERQTQLLHQNLFIFARKYRSTRARASDARVMSINSIDHALTFDFPFDLHQF